MSRAIIFGISGQDGYYLEKILQEQQIIVTGVSRSPGPWQQGDISNRTFVSELIHEIKPDYIFHLAAHSKTNHALLFEHQATIVQGTMHILEAVHQFAPDCRVFITGSGLQFVNKGEPISATDPFEARDAYSLSRIQSVYAARYYRHLGIKTYVGYLFHHDSPLRGNNHLNRKIADAALAAAAGQPHSLSIGDITVEKEFGFAGDIAAGMLALVQQEEIHEACIGTGKAYQVKDWLEICFELQGLKWQDYVQIKDNYVADFRKMVSNPARLNAAGWSPKVDIRELAMMMLKPAPAR